MMYSCERCSPSDAGGRGPKLTSFETCSYAFAPSKPPVWSAGGATSANRGGACAGAAAPELDGSEDADEGAFDAPQATTPDSTTTADANQNLLETFGTLLRLPTCYSLRLFFPQHNVRNQHAHKIQ